LALAPSVLHTISLLRLLAVIEGSLDMWENGGRMGGGSKTVFWAVGSSKGLL
jgi:hypothetical protein